jgi:hypothetical protein
MSVGSDAINALPSVWASLNYLASATVGKPYRYTYDPPPGVPLDNITYESHRVPIRNARRIAANVSLDEEGFALVRHRSAVRDFYSKDEIRKVYYPEAVRLLTEETGAVKVHVFDHTVRRHSDDRPPLDSGRPGGDGLRGPLLDAPLAVCDARTVSAGDLVPSDLIYRERTGEVYQVRHSPAHSWFYVSALQEDEALLLKCYDSAEDGRARFAPHTAFEDPSTPSDASPRESIELRAFVFYRD